MARMTMVQAINMALHQERPQDDGVIVLGEDVGVDGGVFRVTEGLLKAFGTERVIDTPLAESAIAASVQKTGRAVIVAESPRSFGPTAEVVAARVTAEDVRAFAQRCVTAIEVPTVPAERISGDAAAEALRPSAIIRRSPFSAWPGRTGSRWCSTPRRVWE